MASDSRTNPKILMVMNGPPWSSWTMSGVSAGVCNELKRRNFLYGAISHRCLGLRTLRSPGYAFPLYEKVCRWLNRLFFRSPSPWKSEDSSGLVDLLRHAPENLPVIYTYVNPDPSEKFELRRFRWIGISVLDAARNRAYGYEDISKSRLSAEFERQYKSIHRSEAIFTHSTYGADSIAQHFDYPREKIFPIGAGASLRPSQPINTDAHRYRRANILFVGRDWDRKGGPLVYDAFLRLKTQFPQATLTIVGPNESPVSGDGIIFEGFLRKHKYFERRKLKKLFQDASIFCTPSVCETWGLVYVEAAASGLPIVGTNEWAMPDIVISGRTGILCDERSPQALADAMGEILSDTSLAVSMGKAATAHVEEVLDWPHVVDRMMAGINPNLFNKVQPAWLPGDQCRVEKHKHQVTK